MAAARANHRGLRKITSTSWWPWLKRAAVALFFFAVAILLVLQARAIDWGQVVNALKNYSLTAVGAAVALTLASFALYSCFDLLGRRYTGHALGTPTVMLVTFISYAFNLNLGAAVGSVAFRYRLYSRLGLDNGIIARITSLSILSNWIGYVLLGGLVFSLQPPALPAGWNIDSAHLRFVGFAMLSIPVAYLGVCAYSRRRSLSVRGHGIELPSARMAVLQMLMGTGNWLLMSGIIFVLLQHRIEFSAAASALLLAAVAGVLTHIPAGLGVLEVVFVALLSHQMPRHELLAALVAYRLVYYLAPLGVATVVYIVMEAKGKQRAQPGLP
jgi:uncharacterized membrane protein YbhN (UPF0104 family)